MSSVVYKIVYEETQVKRLPELFENKSEGPFYIYPTGGYGGVIVSTEPLKDHHLDQIRAVEEDEETLPDDGVK